jgi:hypothetical protein
MSFHTIELPTRPFDDEASGLWGEIVDFSSRLPYARINAGIRPCREVLEDPDNPRSARTKERQPILGEIEPCLGGPFIRLRLQPNTLPASTIQVFAHNIPAGACAHGSLVNQQEQTDFFKQVNRPVNSYRLMSGVLGAGVVSWMEGAEYPPEDRRSFVAHCLGSATCFRLMHSRSTSVGVSTALRNAPADDLRIVRDKMHVAFASIRHTKS